MRGNAVIQDGWALCPRCWGKLCRVLPGGRAQGVVLRCRRCREDVPLRAGPPGEEGLEAHRGRMALPPEKSMV